jgi:antitoxin component of MazEF toxin-antitoxin module
MSKSFIIKPYKIGSNRRTLGMTIPSKVVKALEIDPLSEYLLLKVSGKDDLQLKVLRKEDLYKEEEAGKAIPASTGISL